LLDTTRIVGYIGIGDRGIVYPGLAPRERGPAFFHGIAVPGRGGRAVEGKDRREIAGTGERLPALGAIPFVAALDGCTVRRDGSAKPIRRVSAMTTE